MNNKHLLQGCIPAMVTPFQTSTAGNATVDYQSLTKLTEHLINGNVGGLCLLGTTGESVTINSAERTKIIQHVVNTVNGRVPILLGAGSNNTATTMELTKEGADLGVDAVMIVTPYYNKPQESFYIKHYETVANTSTLPIIMYNIPSRTGVDMTTKAILHLAQHPNIIGIKEGADSLEKIATIISQTDNSFALYSASDSENLPILALGATGAITVLGNIVPQNVAQICHHISKGNLHKAQTEYYKTLELSKIIFRESSPAPTKLALTLMGIIENELRAPLYTASQETEQLIRTELNKLNLQLK